MDPSLIVYIAAILGGLILIAAIITGILIARKVPGTEDFDYLLVLGAAVRGTEPSITLRDRIRAAHSLLAENENLTCIVSGGKADSKNISEALCMFNALTTMGIPAQRIWIEDKAISTLENLAFSKALIREKTGKAPERLGVISSECHLFRVRMLAKKAGHKIVPLYATSTKGPKYCIAFLREILVTWYYAIFGI